MSSLFVFFELTPSLGGNHPISRNLCPFVFYLLKKNKDNPVAYIFIIYKSPSPYPLFYKQSPQTDPGGEGRGGGRYSSERGAADISHNLLTASLMTDPLLNDSVSSNIYNSANAFSPIHTRKANQSVGEARSYHQLPHTPSQRQNRVPARRAMAFA